MKRTLTMMMGILALVVAQTAAAETVPAHAWEHINVHSVEPPSFSVVGGSVNQHSIAWRPDGVAAEGGFEGDVNAYQVFYQEYDETTESVTVTVEAPVPGPAICEAILADQNALREELYDTGFLSISLLLRSYEEGVLSEFDFIDESCDVIEREEYTYEFQEGSPPTRKSHTIDVEKRVRCSFIADAEDFWHPVELRVLGLSRVIGFNPTIASASPAFLLSEGMLSAEYLLLPFFLLGDDVDRDGIAKTEDNCVMKKNADQANLDGDRRGDACDTDIDHDGLINENDNCPTVFNPDQRDDDSCTDAMEDPNDPADPTDPTGPVDCEATPDDPECMEVPSFCELHPDDEECRTDPSPHIPSAFDPDIPVLPGDGGVDAMGAGDGGGCSLAGGSMAANPLAFALVLLATVPMVRRRRRRG